MKVSSEELNEFYELLNMLLSHSEITQMNHFIQHGDTTCLEHCLTVAYYSYLFAKYHHLNVDYNSLIRGALLHDFFLYDWHIKESHERFHGFKHPAIALENAEQLFQLTPIECDIIRHHMWPLTPIPPHSTEAYIINFMDKWCSLRETFKKPLPPALDSIKVRYSKYK